MPDARSGLGACDDSYSSSQAAYRRQLMTEDIPADLAVAAWAMEAHLCNEAFASRWPPPSVELLQHQHEMSANWHVRIRGAEHQGAGRHRIGSRESRAAHQTPCRLHVPAFLVQPRVSKRFRRGNTMPSFSHNLTCKRSPSISGRPSRHTLC